MLSANIPFSNDTALVSRVCSMFIKVSDSGLAIIVKSLDRGSCCCSAYISYCHQTASDANLLDDPHTFHCSDYFVVGGICTCLGVSDVPVDFFEFLSTEFAACSKPPSRDNYRKASYPRAQLTAWPGCGLNPDHSIRVVVKTTPLPIGPRCR